MYIYYLTLNLTTYLILICILRPSVIMLMNAKWVVITTIRPTRVSRVPRNNIVSVDRQRSQIVMVIIYNFRCSDINVYLLFNPFVR
jgi:hypothetical protein